VGGVSSYFGIFSLDFVVWYRTLGRQPTTTKIRGGYTQHDVVVAEHMTTTPKPQFFNVLKVGDLINTLILCWKSATRSTSIVERQQQNEPIQRQTSTFARR
jgi:hypothetical protein